MREHRWPVVGVRSERPCSPSRPGSMFRPVGPGNWGFCPPAVEIGVVECVLRA